MLSKKEYLAIALVCALALVVVFLAGCGGNGGHQTPTEPPAASPAPTPAPAPPQTNIAPITITTGGATVEAPIGSVPPGTTLTAEVGLPTVKPPEKDEMSLSEKVAITPSNLPVAPITVSFNYGLASRVMSTGGIAEYAPIALIKGEWEIVGTMISTIGRLVASVEPGWFREAGAGVSLGVIVARVALPPLDHRMNLIKLAGSDNLNSNPVFLVHGILSDYKSMSLVAQMLVSSGRYSSAWSLNYDWGLAIEEVGQYLGNITYTAHCEVTYVGHSRGGIICRWADEISPVMYKVKQVNKMILICSPNEGNRFDLALRALQKAYFNTERSGRYPTADLPAMQELARGSSATGRLMSSPCWNSGVKYYLFSANSDLVVDQASAEARSTNIEMITGQPVLRQSLPGTHSSLINTEPGIRSWLPYIK